MFASMGRPRVQILCLMNIRFFLKKNYKLTQFEPKQIGPEPNSEPDPTQAELSPNTV